MRKGGGGNRAGLNSLSINDIVGNLTSDFSMFESGVVRDTDAAVKLPELKISSALDRLCDLVHVA